MYVALPIAFQTPAVSARSKSAFSPPAMIASVASAAPRLPPETGASRWPTPRSASHFACSLAICGGIDAMSMNTAPRFILSAAPLVKKTSRTTGPLSRMDRMKSAPATASAGSTATRAPWARSGSVFPFVRFQTVTSKPAFIRFAAIGAPMIPVPRNAALLAMASPFDLSLAAGLLRRYLLHRQRLEHADAIAFGVGERDVVADPRDHHRVAEHHAARARHLLDRLSDVLHGDDDRRMLARPVRLLREESAVDHPGLLRHAVGRALGRPGQDVVTHLLAQLRHLPSERCLVELRQAGRIVVRHLEVNNGIHVRLLEKGVRVRPPVPGAVQTAGRVSARLLAWLGSDGLLPLRRPR